MNGTNLQATIQTNRTSPKTQAKDDANSFLKGVFGSKDDFKLPVLKSITPEIAQKLLERNTHNRTLRKGHVEWLAKQMELGYWLFTGDCIRFSENGVLCDKQHTLRAIIESGTTQKFIVICGLDNRVIDVLDTGIARTAGDVLKMNGIPNANNMAAICKKVLLFKAGRRTNIIGDGGTRDVLANDREGVIVNMRILDEVSRNSAYGESALAAAKYYDMFRAITLSQYGAFHFLFSEKSPDDAWEFLSKFASGIGLDGESPVYLLRKRMEQQSLSNIRYNSSLVVYWFISCWNKYRRGEKLKILQTPPTVVVPDII